EAMERELKWGKQEWSWVIMNVEEDLDRLQQRLRHLTALAGAVFFLLMQGIDSLTHDGWIGDVSPSLGTNSSEWVGLALFLLLLYLSGQQNIQILRRYLGCARLVKENSERS